MAFNETALGILVIDDLRLFGAFKARYARTSAEGKAILGKITSTAPLDELWLDHDLGQGDDIRSIVLWLAERAYFGDPLPVKEVVVISKNPIGAEWMMNTLAVGYKVRRAEPSDYDCRQIEGSPETRTAIDGSS